MPAFVQPCQLLIRYGETGFTFEPGNAEDLREKIEKLLADSSLSVEMGSEACFIDPSGDVLPCNGMNSKIPMGNIREQTFDEIWKGRQADDVRKAVDTCNKECWMVGNVVPVRCIRGL